MRPSLQGGDYICGRLGLTPAKRDPVTGFQPLPSGPDCRDMNPDGECEHYTRGVQPTDMMLVTLILAMILAAILGAS